MFVVSGLAFAKRPTPQAPPKSSIIDQGLGVKVPRASGASMTLYGRPTSTSSPRRSWPARRTPSLPSTGDYRRLLVVCRVFS